MNESHNDAFDDTRDFTEADRNVERLLRSAYQPEPVAETFAERVRLAMHAAAAKDPTADGSSTRQGGELLAPATEAPPPAWKLAIAAAIAASVIFALFSISRPGGPRHVANSNGNGTVDGTLDGEIADWIAPTTDGLWAKIPLAGGSRVDRYVMPRDSLAAVDAPLLAFGMSLETGDHERKRARLPDGSVVWLNENSSVQLNGDRRLSLRRGEAFFEVAPRSDVDASEKESTFVVVTPQRDVVALGTKFVVRVEGDNTDVVVAQGKVAVEGAEETLTVGEQMRSPRGGDLPRGGALPLATVAVSQAPRVTAVIDWARDLYAEASPPLVPVSDHAGGALLVKDAQGKEVPLSMRKYHVDVHIEDGFARTTIDQTYFNHLPSRQEGTFFFPLPADASISRLAMYVAGKLMEGGMAERQHAAQVFESIKRKMQDPALLEWIDGTTFRMRVFPLEGREEKRIVLSYTQRLPSLYGKATYRFPAGHNLGTVGLWSARVHVDNAASVDWRSTSHTFAATEKDDRLTLTTVAKDASLDRDIVVELTDAAGGDDAADSGLRAKAVDRAPQFARAEHEKSRYFMLRQRPELTRTVRRERRDWILLVETSADRDPLLARAQIEVARGVLEHVEHDDTFTILTAAATTNRLTEDMPNVTAQNVREAIARLEDTQLLGALDLSAALAAAEPIAAACANPYLVHLGGGHAVLGEREQAQLVAALPGRAKYIGIGVGKRWNRSLMKLAASKTGGYFTQINPDENITWRSLDLVSTLNAPRLLDVKVTDDVGRAWLAFDDAVADGEEVCAVARLDAAGDAPAPKSVTISGNLDGQTYKQTYQLENVAADVAKNAGYLPRMWAKLEIDRLVAENATAHKERITELSMAMYVMSPFTSLLVLENEAMYAQYKVDRGRKDHWAMYPCPEEIEVVRDPLPTIARADKQGIRPDGEPTTELETKLAEVNAKTLAAYQSVYVEPRFLASYGVDARNLGRRSSVVRYRLNDGTLREKTVNFSLAMGQPHFQSGTNGGAAVPYLTHFGRPSRTTEGIDLGYDVASRYGFLRGDDGLATVASELGLGTLGERQLGWALNSPVAVDGYRRDGHSIIYYNLPATAYPSDDFLTDLTDRRKQLASVNLGDVEYERYYRQLGQSNGVVRLHKRYDDYGFDGRGVVDGLSRTPGNWAWIPVPTNGRAAGSPPPYLWSTMPLDIATKTGQVDWLRPPQTSFMSSLDVNGNGLPQGLYDRLASAQHPVRPGEFAIVGSRNVQSFGEQREIKLFPTVDFSYWDADSDRDGPPSDYWFEPSWMSPQLQNEMEVEQLVRAAGQIRTLIRTEALTLDEKQNTTTLRGQVRVEYLDELDQIVVTGSPRDTETITQLIRDLDESGGSRNDLFAGIDGKSQLGSARGTSFAKAGKNAGFVGRYAAGQLPSGPAFPGEKLNLVYQPPTFAPLSTFARSASSLVGYAPGMYTTAADVQAVLEDEVREQRPTLGKIDDAARKLIERARSRGWQQVTIPRTMPPGTMPHEPMAVLVDGQGRHRYTSHTQFGLAEQVVCDGQHQWRLYDELGIGAKRAMSRYHRAEIEALVPWIVPMAEDLAVSGDVVSVDERTVAVVREVEWEVLKVAFDREVNPDLNPVVNPVVNPEATDVAESIAGKKVAKLAKIDVERILAEAKRETRTTRYELRLVLADDGRLTERQWLVDGKLLLRVTYAADGRIAWRDAKGQLLAERKLDVRPAAEPSLTPDERRLVVLPLPWRRWGTGPTAELKKNKALDYANYTDDEAMAALSALLVENDTSAVQNLIAQRYFGSPQQIRGKRTAADRRLGFYMILCLAGCNWQPDSLVAVGSVVEQKIAAAPLADYPDSPMAWLLARELADRKIGHAEPPAMPEILGDKVDRSLAATLIVLRRLYPADDPATEVVETAPDQIEANVLRHWQVAHAFVKNTRSPMLALAVLPSMKATAGKSGTSWERIALSYERWKDSPGWSAHARYEAGRAWFRSGDRRRAEAKFSAWYAAQVDAGQLPLVDDDFRMTFYGPNDENRRNGDPLANEFSRKLLGAAKKFTAEGQGAAAMLVAWQAYQLNHSALGNAILNRTLSALPSDEADAAKFAAVAVLYHTEQWERADQLLTPLLDDERFANVTPLWLLAADLAERRGRIASSVARWERVAEIEYERLFEKHGEEYEVAAARQPYVALMQRYEKLVTATTESLSVDSEPPAELVARVVRTADRWRTLDNDATAACLAAAKVLSTLGDDELAWQYATTPLVQQDASATPYESIAGQLAASGAIDLALRAYDAAAAADRGNAKLLWDRAKLLETSGRFGEARETYRRVAEGEWPAEHADLKRQAAEQLSVEAK